MGSVPDTTAVGEAWGRTTSNYTSTVAHASAVAASYLVNAAKQISDIDKDSKVLDLGAGTGAVALEVARNHPSSWVLATDISPKMVESIAEIQIPNVSTQVLDGQHVGSLGNEIFSHIFSTFVLQFIPKPETVLSGSYDALKPGGVIGLGIWHENIAPFVIWEKACRTIDPSYQNQTEFPDPNAWVKHEQLKRGLEAANFVDVTVTDIWMPFKFSSVEAYMGFWNSGQNPSAWHVIRQWKGDRKQAMDAVEKVVEEQYGNGQDIKLHALIGIGRKA